MHNRILVFSFCVPGRRKLPHYVAMGTGLLWPGKDEARLWELLAETVCSPRRGYDIDFSSVVMANKNRDKQHCGIAF
jgi:hypothetical protein